ncbi:MAG: replication initiation protein [Endozoicomonadaceae bacterium]|nr:replication initiation protein [Endozoicomonadaceae bacterium]
MHNPSITKSNQLIEASYRLSSQAQKLVLACLSKVDSRGVVPKEITITALEYAELMQIPNAHRELYKAADSLWDAEITVKEDGKNIRLRWIQKDIQIPNGEGAVTIVWTDEVLAFISQLKSRFTTYKLKQVSGLQSGHSIRLYELLMQFKSTGERMIYVDDFKSAMGITGTYEKFKELNKFVIKKAVTEINIRTDLTVNYETIKKGRSVVALSFQFKQNKQIKMDI